MRGLRLRRYPRVLQHDITDCGAACLKSICTYHGRRVPISTIRQLASTDRLGTNILGLVEAATRLGFAARGVRGDADSLPRIPLPAIAHVVTPEKVQHYLVVYEVRGRRIVIMDPGDGRVRTVDLVEFMEMWTGVLLILTPSDSFDAGDRSRSPLTRLFRLVRPHRSVMVQALVGALIYTILGLSTAIYVQKIVDHVLVDGNRNLLNLLGTAMVIVLLAQLYLGMMKSVLALRTGQKIDAELILGYYRHLLRLPQRFFDTMRLGEVVARVGDAVKIRAFINDSLLDLAVHVLVVVFSFTLMFAYSWKLALVMMGVLPMYGGVFWITNHANRRLLRLLMERSADVESFLVESIGAMSTLRRFNLAAHSEGRAESRFVRLLRSAHGASLTSIYSSGGTEFVSRLAVIVLFWVGGTFVIAGEMTPGELMSFYALLGYLTGPVTQLVGSNRTIQDALIAADRLFEIMDLEIDNAEGIDLDFECVGDIHFENVSFRYGTRELVLEQVDFLIEHGRMTAIVGESGSGKSTAMSILQKLYPVESGVVRIGRYDIRHIRSESLRRHIAAVPQDVHLFGGTVIENIAIGDPEPDMNRILQLSDELGITPLVDSLPMGFHTPLGENGMELSGGQRQRIGIARALYRQPTILILDEATSHLDSLAEAEIQRCLERLRSEGMTIIVIAHRLATVAKADRIVVLRAGQVTETGTHEELLTAAGCYAELWYRQHGAGVDSNEPVLELPLAEVTG